MKALGIVLILGGILALAYGGFSWTTHRKAIDMGPLQVECAQRHTVLLPPLVGVGGLLVGGLLLVVASRSR